MSRQSPNPVYRSLKRGGRPDSGRPQDVGEGAEMEFGRSATRAGSESDGPVWLAPAVAGFVALGGVLRVFVFAMNPPLWGDEACLAVNFLDRGYRDLLRPLDYGQ